MSEKSSVKRGKSCDGIKEGVVNICGLIPSSITY